MIRYSDNLEEHEKTAAIGPIVNKILKDFTAKFFPADMNVQLDKFYITGGIIPNLFRHLWEQNSPVLGAPATYEFEYTQWANQNKSDIDIYVSAPDKMKVAEIIQPVYEYWRNKGNVWADERAAYSGVMNGIGPNSYIFIFSDEEKMLTKTVQIVHSIFGSIDLITDTFDMQHVMPYFNCAEQRLMMHRDQLYCLQNKKIVGNKSRDFFIDQSRLDKYVSRGWEKELVTTASGNDWWGPI